MKLKDLLRGVVAMVLVSVVCLTQAAGTEKPQLKNPLSVDFLQKNLRKEHPRLGLTPEIEANLRSRLQTDPVLRNLYRTLQRNAREICQEPLLTRNQVGRRLLSTSREMLRRMNVLCFVYRMEPSPALLARIDEELRTVCAFKDWNPSHFLDVAEMSMAMALGLDWTMNDLPDATVRTVQTALINLGLRADGQVRIVAGENNWNQVCNGGMIAAALAVADAEPELAASVISRALDALPNALVHYGPEGAHPEGSTYWQYATMYTAMTSSLLETALGTDFGIFEYPGFAESAMYRVVMNAPSGWYFNYGDCGDKRSERGDMTLAWFASKTGDAAYFEKDRFLQPAGRADRLERCAGLGMAWIAGIQERSLSPVPAVWSGRGLNPVVVFQDRPGGAHQYYLGAKGGRAAISHGNMDAGSFVFELNGIRWAVELGKQSYHTIEKTGFNLWDMRPEGDRWKLLSKNNFGHNTLTVNEQHHVVDGAAPLLFCREEPTPEAAFDLTRTFGGLVTKAIRTFTREHETAVLITDSIIESEKTESIAWQMLTVAEVKPVTGGALLKQAGKTLHLEILSHPAMEVTIVALNPPPLELDRVIPGLKRLEIRIPGTSDIGRKRELKVRLSEGQ